MTQLEKLHLRITNAKAIGQKHITVPVDQASDLLDEINSIKQQLEDQLLVGQQNSNHSVLSVDGGDFN